MTRRAGAFLLIAFAACVAIMLVGFGLLLQDSVAAQVVGFVLVEAAFVFALLYFVVLPGRRVRAWRERLAATNEADLLRPAGATAWKWQPINAKDGGGYWRVEANGDLYHTNELFAENPTWVKVSSNGHTADSDDAPTEPLTPYMDEE